MKTVPRFSDARDAKEFLVSGILGEAASRGVQLSDVERGMLYFSETGWTLPDIAETAEMFERQYNQHEYEEKIVGLIRSLLTRLRKRNRDELQCWLDAVRTIDREDHYILVMVQQAGFSQRRPGDLLRLWATGFAICVGVLLFIAVFPHFDLQQDPESFAFLAWTIAFGVVCAYLLFYVLVGKARAIDLTNKFVEALVGFFARRK